MAIIGSIRRRSTLLMLIIGLALLAFILGDLFGSGGLGGNQVRSVGEIDGAEITQIELEQKTAEWTDIYQNIYRQSITADQARNVAWQDLLKNKLLLKEIEATGIRFASPEFDDIRYGEGVLDEFKSNPNFQNPETGQFDPEAVKRTYRNLYDTQDVNATDQQREANRRIWNTEKKRLEDNRLTSKYNTLITKTIIATDIEARDAYHTSNSAADIQYVMKKFTDIPNEDVNVSDNDIKAYYNSHKGDKKYKQRAERDMSVVSFDVLPTADDKSKIESAIGKLIVKFRETDNDSIYVSINSDSRQYAPSSKSREQMDSTLAAQIFSAAIGAVVGPYEDGGQYKLTKVLGDDTKDEATVRHILISSNESNDSEKKALADSIETAIKRGADFESLVDKYTDDPGSKATGGKYEWFPKGQMVPPFENFSFDERIGAIGTVKTDYGYHVIEVLDRRTNSLKKTVDLVKNIVPSAQTFQQVYQDANAFAVDNDNAELFNAEAEALGLKVTPANNIVPSSQAVTGIGNSREAVRWAYKPERRVGDVSSPIEAGEKFIVVMLNGAREEGIPAYEDVMEEMKTVVTKEKKAAQFATTFGTYSNLDEAAANAGSSVQTGAGLSMSTVTVPGGGREPSIVGTVFSMNEGDISKPLTGDFGVYVLQVKSKQVNTGEGVDMTSNRNSAMNQYRSQVGVLMNKALNDARGVKNDISRVY